MGRILSINNYDMSNGPGVRASIWFAGCTHKCKGCHNVHTWNPHQGEEFTGDFTEIDKAIEEYFIKDVSILGGEPLDYYNIEAATAICKHIKEKYNVNIMLWTGYLYEQVKDLGIMKYIDTLIDGPFIQELKQERLELRGSTNQRVIHFKNLEE